MAKQQVPYPSLDTPAVLVNLDKLEANIQEMSRLTREAGLRLRVHIKVHECAEIAKMQLAAGACGVEVGPIAQAEAMAEEGIDDIVVAHPGYYGDQKQETLRRLLRKPGLRLAIVVDMPEQAEGISQAAQVTGRTVPVLIKIETCLGAGAPRSQRHGVLPGEPTLNLARRLLQLPGIEFEGIYAHEMGAKPTQEGVDDMAYKTAEIVTDTARMLRGKGIEVKHVSVGASPTLSSTCRFVKEGKFPELTEVHPGNRVIGDIMYMMARGNTIETCALTVLVTVMSTTHAGWAMVDAGYKTFGAESLIGRRDTPGFFWDGRPSFGHIIGRPDLRLANLSAETGHVFYVEPGEKLHIGQRLEIIPNNATLVTNLHDHLYGVRNGVVEKVFKVTGRGRGN